MLSLTPDALADEVNRAEQFRYKHTARVRAIAERFVGNWYRSDHVTPATPENTVFAYVAYMLPELWYANPSCRVTDNGQPDSEEAGNAIEEAVRAWIRETKFGREGQQVTRDALIGFGVIQVGLEPRDFQGDRKQGGDDGPLRPFAVRIGPDQLIIDPQAETPEKARFIGHTYFMDLADLQADVASGGGKWDPDAVARLGVASTNESGDQREKPLEQAAIPERGRVSLVDLWIPEHGRLITLARDNEATNSILRDVPYYGPPEGPYEIFGFYDAPGDPYPLSPLAPIMEQLEELWVHQRAASSEAESYKRFVMADAANQDMQKAITSARSGDLVLVKGLNASQWAEVEMGGSPTGRLEHIAAMRDRADRTIGLSDAQRGRVQGKTATETDIVQGNVDTRTSYLRQRIQYHTTNVLRRIGWYLFNDPAVVMPIRKVDQMSGQVLRGTFMGGQQPGQEHLDWSDFHLEIEPTSMQHSDDAVLQQRAMETIQVAQTVGELMQMMPFVNWRVPVEMFGESFNQKNLFERLFNPQALMAMQAQAMLGAGGVSGAPVPGDGSAPGGMGGPGAQWGPNGAMGSADGSTGAPIPQQGAMIPQGGAPAMGGGGQRGAMQARPSTPFMFMGKGGGKGKGGATASPARPAPGMKGGGPRAAMKPKGGGGIGSPAGGGPRQRKMAGANK